MCICTPEIRTPICNNCYSKVEHHAKQLATAKLEGFNEGIEAVITTLNSKLSIADTYIIRALKHESLIQNDELGEVV